MVPIPEFDDFEQFNQKLADDCRKDWNVKLRGKSGTKLELLEEDRRAMRTDSGQPLRGEACRKRAR